MISRLTASAAAFAILATAAIAYAAEPVRAQPERLLSVTAAPVLVEFPGVEVTGRRSAGR